MSKAIAISRQHAAHWAAQWATQSTEMLRMAIVATCACSLLAAGQFLPL